MLFNFGKRKETVGHSELIQYLNMCFNSSSAQFDSKCRSIELRIDDLLKRFIDICDGFERSKERPEHDIEYTTARVSPEVIESQKRVYIKAIRDILSEKLDKNSENYYEAHEHLLKEIRTKLDNLSKNNNTFRHVFLSYPAHMNSFKEVFGQIDREVGRLKSELERNSDSYKRYKELHERIEELTTKIYRSGEIKGEINEMEHEIGAYRGAEYGDEEISKRAEDSNSRKMVLERELSKSVKSINSLLLPLERPARKYDYLVGKRGVLYSMVTDPINTITDEESYGIFRYNILSMQEAVDKGEIDVKNRADVHGEISAILKSDLFDSLGRVKSIKAEIDEIDRIHRVAEREIEAVHLKRASRREIEDKIGGLNLELDQIGKQVETLRARVAESFIKEYGKNVEIDIRNG
jgi:predicted nuclease with TOPRIM domain